MIEVAYLAPTVIMTCRYWGPPRDLSPTTSVLSTRQLERSEYRLTASVDPEAALHDLAATTALPAVEHGSNTMLIRGLCHGPATRFRLPSLPPATVRHVGGVGFAKTHTFTVHSAGSRVHNMRRLRQLTVVVAPVLVVLALGEIHAHLVGHYSFTGTQRFAWTAGYIVLLEFSAYVAGVLDDQRSTISVIWSAFAAAFGGAAAISLCQLALGSLLLPREVVFSSAVILFLFYLLMGMSTQRAWQQEGDRVMAVVAPDEALALEADFERTLERPGRLVATLDPSVLVTSAPPSSGDFARKLVDVADDLRATVVVLGRGAIADESVVAQAALLHGRGVRVRTLALFYDQWFGKLPLADLERISLMFDIQELHTRGYARMKRIIDLISAGVGLVVLLIAIPLVWVADLFGNRGPLFYRQVRTGKGGRPFTILKFRSMPLSTVESEWTRESDPRLGTVGKWMRRLHIDELPQSVNILRGELSLVGPRPEQPRYVEELAEKIPYYDVRHLVLPGVTGWAQVKFGYGAGVEDALEKLQYEFFYLRHQGPILDTRILARTLRSVVRADGR